MSTFFIIFGVIVLLVFGTFLFTIWTIFSALMKRNQYDAKRGEEMQKIAAEIGWQFTPQAEFNLIPALVNFEMFEGSAIKLENVMTGSINGKRAAVFDCLYHGIASIKHDTASSRQTMAFIEDDQINFPMFYLRPEGNLEKSLKFISRIDINFDYRPAFSAKYLLYGDTNRGDETRIRHLFNRQVLDFYEKAAPFCTMAFQKNLSYINRAPSRRPRKSRNGLIF